MDIAIETAALWSAHTVLAFAMFFALNWIGEHASAFGYTSTTLFEEPNDSVALNFLIRALSPTVLIVGLAAIAVAAGKPELRIGLHRVVLIYYGIRTATIFVLNRQRLVSWPKYLAYVTTGVMLAVLAQRHLIMPQVSLLPDLRSAGNELWLAIFAFLYAVANKVPSSTGPSVRRRNRFIADAFHDVRSRFGHIIAERVTDPTLELIVYSVLIFEHYSRPPVIRRVENLMFWRAVRTTGIMQVASPTTLTDEESVARGTDILSRLWTTSVARHNLWDRVDKTVAGYNQDRDYVGRVTEVMEILAKRVQPSMRPIYDALSTEVSSN